MLQCKRALKLRYFIGRQLIVTSEVVWCWNSYYFSKGVQSTAQVSELVMYMQLKISPRSDFVVFVVVQYWKVY